MAIFFNIVQPLGPSPVCVKPIIATIVKQFLLKLRKCVFISFIVGRAFNMVG